MIIERYLFGHFEGGNVYRFVLTNRNGNSVSIINYGAAIVSWEVKDKTGTVRNIVAGFNNLEVYLANESYMGCIAGRYANRIAKGKFTLNGTEYKLPVNNGVNHLHGGNKGFDKVIWDAKIIDAVNPALSLSYVSKDGEEGYPGNLSAKVVYTYTDKDELEIEYFATTDKPTPVNLTSHGYFNLTGDVSNNILNHLLQINANHYTELNEEQIPTGTLKAVDKTAFNFRELKTIAENFNAVKEGFDHNFVLKKESNGLLLAAVLYDPSKEFRLSVYTTEPGLQFYSGNFLNGTLFNRDGKTLNKHAALCLETQHFPDSPNHSHFPSTILYPDKKYSSKTIYKVDLSTNAAKDSV